MLPPAQETSQKIIDVDTAITMLSLTMPQSPHTALFTEYLGEQTEYKTINMDQWTGYLRFTQEVRVAYDMLAMTCQVLTPCQLGTGRCGVHKLR